MTETVRHLACPFDAAVVLHISITTRSGQASHPDAKASRRPRTGEGLPRLGEHRDIIRDKPGSHACAKPGLLGRTE